MFPRIQVGTVALINALPGAPSYLFHNPLETLTASTVKELEDLLQRIDSATAEGLYAAGFIAYEAGYALEPSLRRLLHTEQPLAWFGIYNDRESFSYQPEPSQIAIEDPDITMSASTFADKVSRIKQHIEHGDTYQLNLTTKLQWNYTAPPEAFLHHILAVQPVEFGALLNPGSRQVLSASPELFFRREGSRITTRPMKGTVQRGRNLEEDREKMAWLANDEKNRAENLMIVDLLRNDLGRICATGSVHVDKLFEVERYSTLHQMTSTIHGELRPGVSYAEIFRALFPSGSIVGAPKIKTMELIHTLEEGPRGAYTGCIGFISPDGEACFSVAIRTITLEGDHAEMGIGAGITYDSDATAEYEETRLKGAFLQQDAQPFQLIETMLWDGNHLHLLEEHLARLLQSAAYFDFACDTDVLRHALQQKVQVLSGTHRVRLLCDRGGVFTIESAPIQLEDLPLRVILSKIRTRSGDLFLQHKTTRRKLYDEQLRLARERGFDEVLFLNEDGNISEGAITNFFVERDGKLFTPPLTDGVLPGVLRAHLHPEERSLKLEDLSPMDRLYLGNSVRGMLPIGYLER
ncbi:aminodeoxychorismate synthase component I [Terriglobus albidus]|uniref:aminodeoxychorismate synthase component I n=1 Tax=Terriglobus albidus TaxID=1592106 RepID=UPI00164E0902|nr:aminodeoxychorismate synthase component I [Terriglobus albidus]